MKRVHVQIVAAIFVVLTTFAVLTEGLQCWMGRTGYRPFRYKIECRGSCSKRRLGLGQYEYGCYDIIKPDGCTTCGKFNVPCCFCNKPLCNTGPVISDDGMQFITN